MKQYRIHFKLDGFVTCRPITAI